MSTEKKNPDPQREHRRQLVFALLKSSALPILLLVFFLAAPRWWNVKVRDSIVAEVHAISTITENDKAARIDAVREMNFQKLCHSYPPYLEHLHQGLVNSGVCAHFTRLGWGLLTAQVLAGALVLGLFSLFLLRIVAKRSSSALTESYFWAWRISMALALLSVLAGVPLLAFGVFEFLVLLAGVVFQKLLLMLLIAGGIGAWFSIKVLLSKVPLEFAEGMSREITPQDAPALWEAVTDAARRLGTSPPDHILVGMQCNFYVTELSVRHGASKTTGKTLFLSYPLLKQLPENETVAIIGHELGHLAGNDTVLTRHFFPLRQKALAVVGALAGTGIVALPAVELLKAFWWSFEGVASDASRQREFDADRNGARLTNPRTQASALIRLNIILAAFEKGFLAAEPSPALNPFGASAPMFAAEKMIESDPFWPALFQRVQPHPLDSHPPLHERLAALSETWTPAQAHALAIETTKPAFATWFGKREDLFREILEDVQQSLAFGCQQSSAINADIATPEGRDLLQRLFPPKEWHGAARSFWIFISILAAFTVSLLAGALFVPDAVGKAVLGGMGCLALLFAGVHWLRHRHARLRLTCEGLEYSGWTRPLPFSEVQEITAQRQYSNILLRIRTTPGAEHVWKARIPLLRLRFVTLSLPRFNASPVELADTIFAYYTRRRKVPSEPTYVAATVPEIPEPECRS